MSVHRYRRRALINDYTRSALGLALTGFPLLAVNTGRIGTWVLAALMLLFALFAARTALRHRTTIRIDESGVTAEALGSRFIAWDDIVSVELSYYTTRRDRSAGWMQLALGDGRTTLRLESTLEGFQEVVDRARQAAMARGISLAPKTVNNMRALGLAVREAELLVGENGRSTDRP